MQRNLIITTLLVLDAGLCATLPRDSTASIPTALILTIATGASCRAALRLG